ncbi:MAG: pyruvate kinase [Chloroflexales bacterium]|nr:pyruvate kinase [Chloroflexales bacterium]
MQNEVRRTRIVATIGPASDSDSQLDALIAAGMNVARLNFSHGTHDEHARRILAIRAAAVRNNRSVAILQDLQGPKIRTGALVNAQAVHLEQDATFTITTHPIIGDVKGVSTTYQHLPLDVKVGDRILISDGLLELIVLSSAGDTVTTRVIAGGMLSQNQGINLPGVAVSIPALTEKDRDDLAFGLNKGVDYVALSFVRRAADMELIRAAIAAQGATVGVIAKIEKPEALDELNGILSLCDGVMVARGDLGVEMPPELVPLAQKRIIEAANFMGVPVITATQMLDSMIRNPRPTRAEASDVANAIIDGTDAVMLSGETATGAWPVDSVKMMHRIAIVSEKSGRSGDGGAPLPTVHGPADITADAMSHAACQIAIQVNAVAIIAFTMSGLTARLVSRHRPKMAIIAVSPELATVNRLALVWGVDAYHARAVNRLDDLTEVLQTMIVGQGILPAGSVVVLVGGHPIAMGGATNFVKVIKL